MKFQKTDNKVTVIVLAFMVVTLWGTIIYRILSPGNEEPVQLIGHRAVAQPHSIKKDTFVLFLNYEDPFRVRQPTRAPVKKAVRRMKTSPIESPLPIVYHGILKQISSKQIALIAISGRYRRVREGERVDDYLISTIRKDSIGIRVGGRIRFIKKQSVDK